jgi:predicted Zn-dependent protease with MMP-like domain
MKRDINKTLEQCRELERQKKVTIYASDIMQVHDTNQGDLYRIITHAIMHGVTIGYNAAKREIKKAAANSKGA